MRLAGFKGWACSCGKACALLSALQERPLRPAFAAQVHARPEQGGSAAEASARQEPPPKCVVLLAEGVAEAVERGQELAALHHAARDGCCGFVALRSPPPDAGDAAVHCVSQLLCLLDGATPLAQRTKGLRVVVASAAAAVRACAADAGATAAELVDSAGRASQLLGLLGLGGEPGREAADVVLAHLQPAGGAPWQQGACDASAAALDALLRELVACSDVAERLYIVLLLGRCDAAQPSCAPPSLPAHLAHLRPEQSYTAQRRGGIEERALLCVHSLRGVVRRDEAACAGHAEFVARGARGAVLADDVLVELAFKLGRASKYGA